MNFNCSHYNGLRFRRTVTWFCEAVVTVERWGSKLLGSIAKRGTVINIGRGRHGNRLRHFLVIFDTLPVENRLQ